MDQGQDGGTGGSGVHSSLQVHQEYIYKWNSSHRAPLNTGDLTHPKPRMEGVRSFCNTRSIMLFECGL